jgi:carbamoyltransferase
LRSFLKAMPVWLQQKLWQKAEISEALPGFSGPILFTEHHESHAASAFYPSPFLEAAVLTVDGVGEWTTTSFGFGQGNRLTLESELTFPHSLGLLYSAFTYYCGFRVNSGEYKLMGLAPYGEPRYVEVIRDKLLDLKPDGSFRLNLVYFDFPVGLTMTNERFNTLFGGAPRKPESPLTQREMDLARSIQVVTEEILLRISRHVHKTLGQDRLCLAGGVALNCVANGRILRESGFKEVWIQPAAGDAGGAVGAAWAVWHRYLDQDRTPPSSGDAMHGSYLGPQFAPSAIREFLEANSIPYTEYPESELPDKVADLLAQGKVIGWFQGRMEFGPRALGARSILGDPRSPRMQEVMNLKIKFRESFRPFAPSVLSEHVQDWFDLDQASPYMLLVAPVAAHRCRDLTDDERRLPILKRLQLDRSEIPAVTHVDGSARIQTVGPDGLPQYRALLEAFHARTGCPLLVNTSFNVRGEPIVATPEDALRCFQRTNLDVLVLGGCVVQKTSEMPLDKDPEWLKEFELD